MVKDSTMSLAARGATAIFLAALLLGVTGCPIQTPAVELGQLGVSVSSAAPLPGQTLTFTALPSATASTSDASSVDLSAAQWTTSDPTVVTLSTSSGPMIMAVAGKVGTATVTVSAGGLTGAAVITVLSQAAGNVNLDGPTSLNLDDVKTYMASVTDTAGNTIAASVTWVASGSVKLAPPGSNTGASMKILAKAVGLGAVTASAGGRSAQIAVKVTSTNGQLVVTQENGMPFPSMLAPGQTLTAKATIENGGGTSDATTAQWTSTGVCMLIGSSGATVSVEANGGAALPDGGVGSCTITATANGMTAMATFTISNVTAVAIMGDTSPIPLGASRMYTAVATAGATAIPGIAVTWSMVGAAVATFQPSGTEVVVTSTAVGSAMLVATVQGMVTAAVTLTVAPAMLQLQATSTRLLSGTGATVTATPLSVAGLAGKFASPLGVTLAGATGFASVGPASLTVSGLVTFALGGATAPSPAVTATFGAVTSNALAFSIAVVSTVAISGPQGPVRAGSTVDFTAIIKDAGGMAIGGAVPATWTDVTGVYALPEATNTLAVTGTVVKLGTAAIVATVEGVSSPAFMSPSVPGSIGVTPFSPATVAVGGMATTVVTVFDVNGVAVPGVPLANVSMMSADGTKVSVDMGAVMGNAFLFTATGLAATLGPGVGVTPTWTDGTPTDDVMGAQVFLVVTGP